MGTLNDDYVARSGGLRRVGGLSVGPNSDTELKFTRRSALKLSGFGLMGATDLISPGLRGGAFSVIIERRRVRFCVGGRDVWVIDCGRFAGEPRLRASKTQGRIHVRLDNARIAGCNETVVFECMCTRRWRVWSVVTRLFVGNYELSGRGDLEDFLTTHHPLVGSTSGLRMQGSRGSPPWRLTAGLLGARVELDRAWNWRIAPTDAIVTEVGDLKLSARSLLLSLPRSPGLVTANLGQRRVRFTLLEPVLAARYQCDSTDASGELTVFPGKVAHSELEAVESRSGRVTAGLLICTADAGTTGRYQTEARTVGHDGNRTQFALTNIRVARRIDHSSSAFSLHANLASPATIASGSAVVTLKRRAGHDDLVIVKDKPAPPRVTFTPEVASYAIAVPGALADTFAPTARFVARMGRATTDGGAPQASVEIRHEELDSNTDIHIENPCLSLLRPQDMLALHVVCRNLRLTGTTFGHSRLERIDRRQPTLLAFHFPPQHVLEKSFYEGESCSSSTEILDKPPVRALLAGTSRLAFVIDKALDRNGRLPLTLQRLLDWNKFELVLAPPPQLIQDMKRPGDFETDIEFPTRLHLAPAEPMAWTHSIEAPPADALAVLWHTRMQSADASPAQLIAVWTNELESNNQDPFRNSLRWNDRVDIVRQTHDRSIANRAPAPAPLFALSSLGAWSHIEGLWQETSGAITSLERWRHIATGGRDQKVVIERRGYLYPFGHKVTLVEETERKRFVGESDRQNPGSSPIAYLRTHYYIRIKQKMLRYANWDMPFREVYFVDDRSPYLDKRTTEIVPGNPDTLFWPTVCGQPYRFRVKTVDWIGHEQLWDCPMLFQMKLDQSDNVIVNINALSRQEYLRPENEVRRTPPLNGQTVAVAESTAPGATDVEMAFCEFSACDDDHPPADPCAECATMPGNEVDPEVNPPGFWPRVEKYNARVPAIDRALGSGGGAAWYVPENPTCDPTSKSYARLSLLPARYEFDLNDWKQADKNKVEQWLQADGLKVQPSELTFDAASGWRWASPGEFLWIESVRLETTDKKHLIGYFGPAKGEAPNAAFQDQTDKSGGGLAPVPRITHLSGKFGPIGKPLAYAPSHATPFIQAQTNSALSPSSFFSDDAVILGKIALRDIVAVLLPGNTGGVPALMATVLDYADGPMELRQSLSWRTGNLKRWDLGFLAFQPLDECQFSIDVQGHAWLDDTSLAAELSVNGSVENFRIELNLGIGGILLPFSAVTYQARTGSKPNFSVGLDPDKVEFTGALAVIRTLADKFASLLQAKTGLDLDIRPNGVTIRFPPVNVPTINVGAFSLSNFSIHTWARLPFRHEPIEFGFDFSSPEQPFQIIVGIYGGQGYVLISVDSDRGGIRYLAASLEFGIVKQLQFGGVAEGVVYLFGGVYYGADVQDINGNKVKVVVFRAFVRAGGQVDVLHLISAYLDLYIGLEARQSPIESYMIGEARMRVGFKIAFVHYDVTIYRSERLAGSPSKSNSKAIARKNAAQISGAIGRANSTVPVMGWASSNDFERYWNAFILPEFHRTNNTCSLGRRS
jgi:hypothetical protein